VLDTGLGEGVTFEVWYADAANHSVVNLQVIAEAMVSFDAGSGDPLLNRKVQTFDFAGLVDRFDQALAADPGLANWNLTNALLDFHLAGSDTAALGSDLAYQYGRSGTLAGISAVAAHGVIDSAGFGTAAQTLQPLAGLQQGVLHLV